MTMIDAFAADAATALQGTLLYIEDEPTNVALVEAALLAHPGVRLVHAGSGAEGIRLVRAEKPDFVLLDMHLPDMSGLEVVRQLNTEIAARGLRVTILTGDISQAKRSMIREIEQENALLKNIPIYLSRYGLRVWKRDCEC